MLETIIIILLLLWLLGFFGPRANIGIPRTGNVIHILLVIIVILLIIRLI
jgi:hypothetical protein